MAMITCPECKKKISDTAETCPKCGYKLTPEEIAEAKKKDRQLKKGCGIGCLSVIVIIIAISIIVSLSDNTPNKNDPIKSPFKAGFEAGSGQTLKMSKAKPYSVLDEEDLSFPGRKRMRWFIYSPEASTFEERAETVIQAAKDLRKATGAHLSCILLEASPKAFGHGHILALADYAPDNGGVSGKDNWKWQVESSKDIIDQQTLKILEMWYEKRSSFQTSDGLTDEPNLYKYIAEELNTTIDKIQLPFISLTKYQP